MLKTALGPLSAPRPAHVTALFVVAILAGSLVGTASSAAGDLLGGLVDPLIMLLVGALFFTLRLGGWSALRRAPRTVALALVMNFALIPIIAFGITRLVVPDEALRLGVLIYCLFPCTDWFLGFTRLAKGDTTVGAALIPIQLVLQLALYPVWIGLFTGTRVSATLSEAGPAMLTWFVVPAAAALGLRAVLLLAPAAVRRNLIGGVDAAVPLVIASLIVTLFAANVGAILADPLAFGWVLLAVFLFFVVSYALGEGVARLFRLAPPEHALLTVTTSARNAPLMLALTAVAIPNQPAVTAAIVLGMLIEFPHLTAVTHMLRRERATAPGLRPLPGVTR
ncbi:MAG: arsenic resistance protein [Leucobacter sp.]